MPDSPVERARTRLEHELEDLGIRGVDGAVLTELAHASHRQLHEGALPGYGAIIQTAEAAARTGVTATRTEFEDAERLRQLADGRTSFLERIDDDVALWMAAREITETELVRICRERDARAVRLDPDGALHIVSADRIWSRRRNQWRRRPTADTLYTRLLESTDDCPGTHEVLQGLLDLAVHVLGPRDLGATLVWLPDWDRLGCDQSLPSGGSTPLVDLTDRTMDGAVTNLMRQHDGAALVSPDGALWWVGAELSAPATMDAPVTGGMRHRSAARFSHLRPAAWVFVVSHDGPVSVFVGGQDLTRPLST